MLLFDLKVVILSRMLGTKTTRIFVSILEIPKFLWYTYSYNLNLFIARNEIVFFFRGNGQMQFSCTAIAYSI